MALLRLGRAGLAGGWSERALGLDRRRLRWFSGSHLGLLGALMLIAPHQFDGPSFAVVRPNLHWWGVVFLLAGTALVMAAAVGPPRWLVAAAHGVVGASFLLLASGVLAVGAWLGATGYAVFGLGNVLVATPHHGPAERRAPRGDLASLLVATASLLSGLIVLLWPAQLVSPVFDPVRSLLPMYAAGHLVGGAGVLVAQLRPGTSRPLVWAAHGVLALTLIVFVVPSLPARAWSGILYAGLAAGLLVIVAARGPRLAGGQPSLRTRLAAALATAATLPLVAAVAVTAEWGEQSAAAQALDREQVLAETAAREIGQYLSRHSAAVAMLAALPDMPGADPEHQRGRLIAAQAAYPDARFASVDADGAGVARSDDFPPQSWAALASFQEARLSGRPTHEVLVTRAQQRPRVTFFAPMRFPDGRFAGGIGVGVATEAVFEVASHAAGGRGTAYVVDERGRTIAHADTDVALFADLSGRPAVAALRGGAAGALRDRSAGDVFAAYAPVADVGWGVVVEYPAATVLAGARAGREAAFAVLLVALAATGAAGAVAAQRLTTPLARLSRALTRFGAQQEYAPLVGSDVPEIADLASGFIGMRDQLAARAAERDQLLARAEAARAEAERAARLRDEFLGLAAHELRTPVAGLRGHAQFMVRVLGRNPAPDAAVVQRAMEHIDRQTRRLADLVGELLDVGRIEAGKLGLVRAPVDIDRLVRDVVTILQAASPDRTIALRPAEQVMAVVDAGRVEQVVANLLSNAVKYGRPDAPIAVEVGHLGDATAFIAVRDYGPGVPEVERERIFDRFYQTRRDDEHHGGLGLGLYISRQIVELHGGEIRVEAPAGGGARFVVSLPRGLVPAASALRTETA